MDSILLLLSKIILLKWQLIFWKFYRKKVIHEAWIDMQMNWNKVNSNFCDIFRQNLKFCSEIFNIFCQFLKNWSKFVHREIITIQMHSIPLLVSKIILLKWQLIFWKFYRKKSGLQSLIRYTNEYFNDFMTVS